MLVDRKQPLPQGTEPPPSQVATSESGSQVILSSSPSTATSTHETYRAQYDAQAPPSYDSVGASSSAQQLPRPRPVALPQANMGNQYESFEDSPLLGEPTGHKGRPRQRQTRLRRFCHFVSIAAIVFFVLSLMNTATQTGDSEDDKLNPDLGSWPGKIIGRPDWSPIRYDSHEHEPYIQFAHLELDANHAGPLFVHSLGSRHSGRISVHVGDSSSDKIKIDVEARATHEYILKRGVTVCKRSDGDRLGVGVYSDRESFHDHAHRMRVYVNVTLPISEKGLRKYPDFEVHGVASSIHAGSLRDAFVFDNLDLKTGVGSVQLISGAIKDAVSMTSDAGSLTVSDRVEGDVIKFRTSAGSIRFGDIIANSSVTLSSDAGSIKGESVHSPATRITTNAGSIQIEDVETAEARIRSDVGSVRVGVTPVEHVKGGVTDIDISSNMGKVDVTYSGSPKGKDAKLAKHVRSTIKSDVGSATARHWPQFIGQLDASTSLGSVQVDVNTGKDDGRDFSIDESSRRYARGCVFPKGDNKICNKNENDVTFSRIVSSMGSIQVFF